MVVVGRRKTTLRHLTARLLVLGDKQVGKSASIVRYTTGRYIHNYSDSTNDWLYRHSLGLDSKRNVTTSVELLEQKDIQFCSSSQFFTSFAKAGQPTSNADSNNQSLSSRVAMDQQRNNELQEKQQLLDKLHWANAYIIIYAIDDISTFNKAIKYLNLIANNINSPSASSQSKRPTCSGSSSFSKNHHNSTNQSSNINNNTTNSGHHNSNVNQIAQTSNGRLFSKLSSSSVQLSAHQPHHPNCPASAVQAAHCVSSSCTCPAGYANIKRPILLLGNKKDLEKSARQVNANDARLLAMRHQSMFAEVSIAETSKMIQVVLTSLVEQIDPCCLHVEQLNLVQQQQLLSSTSVLDHWSPPRELTFASVNHTTGSPVWGSLVKSKPVVATIVKSCTTASAHSEVETQPAVAVQSAPVKMARQFMAKELTSADGEVIAKPTADKVTPLSRHNRYENLKSSFRRASMAIVNGRTSTKQVPTKAPSETELKLHIENDEPRKSSSASTMCPQSLSPQVTNAHQGPASWFRSHLRLSRERIPTDQKLEATSSSQSSRFRRPMMKYDIRRKTVAFERISPFVDEEKQAGSSEPVCSSSQSDEVGKIETTSSQDTLLPVDDVKSRASVGRSSSSLSNTDTYFSQQFNSWAQDRAPSSTGSTSICSSNYSTGSNQAARPLTRQNSRSTLSRASTSGGSYEESSDELSPLGNTNIKVDYRTRSNNLRRDEAKTMLPPLGSSGSQQHKKRYQLVRSVQSTLSNLTRSSNISGQMAKKSFCHSMFNHQANQGASSTVKSVVVPLAEDMAKTDQIQVMPVIGFCV